MFRTAAFGAAVAGLFLALPAQAQQQQQQPLRDSPAATQKQVDQPAPDLEDLKEEDLNRTKAAQRLPDNGGQTAALPSPDVLGEWETRLAENPQVLERDVPVQEAWGAVQETHAALEQADGPARQEAQEAYEESLELLERAWSEATD